MSGQDNLVFSEPFAQTGLPLVRYTHRKDNKMRLTVCPACAFAVGSLAYHVPGMVQICGLVGANLAKLNEREVEWFECGCRRDCVS
jgi:hypothetical protein